LDAKPMGPKTEVGPGEVLGDIPGPEGDLRRLSPLQKAGMGLVLGVGLAIVAVTAAVVVDWFLTRPEVPSISAAISPEQAAKLIQNFKELNAINFDRSTKIFDLLVVKAFLPVFTAILGYIFGSRDPA
jgi:hypothetical protein